MTAPPATRPLVSVAWLRAHLTAPNVRVVDVRWALGKPGWGAGEYGGGHVPGALFLDIDRDLSGLGTGRKGPGRHPLPDAEAFAEALGRAGLGDESWIVAYDDAGGATAARLWFLLRYFGHETSLVLDGGFAAWRAAGLPVTSAPPTWPRARFTPRPRPDLVVDRAFVDALRGRSETLLLDARAPERYRGESEPIDAAAGHIPGAKSAPFVENLDEGGRFLSRAALADRYRALGAERASEIICYCGSGVTACHDLLALELAGRKGRLYEGSWSDWSRSGLPVERGDPAPA